MSLVNVLNMIVLDNPTSFTSPFQLEITFECLENLQDDLEWKVLYVRDPQEDASNDLILEEILVGPVVTGVHSFLLCADAPRRCDLRTILGVTALLVTCSYRDQEFCRIGWYVNNEYHGTNNESSSSLLLLDDHNAATTGGNSVVMIPVEEERTIPLSQVVRTILADKPRVTRFPIQWQETHHHDNTTTTIERSIISSTPMKLLFHDATMELTTSPPKIVSPSHDVDMQR